MALARALARQPALVLLDEPFSGLDAPVRGRLYRELRRLQGEAGLTTVLVTHDPEEAALLADEVIVLSDGRVLQQGSVSEVFARPNSTEVAALVGMPNAHLGRVERHGLVCTGGLALTAPTAELAPGTEVMWTVPPELVSFEADGAYLAAVTDTLDRGFRREITLDVGGLELIARTTLSRIPACGSPQRVNLPADGIAVWPAVSP